jgi:hypothetical protein
MDAEFMPEPFHGQETSTAMVVTQPGLMSDLANAACNNAVCCEGQSGCDGLNSICFVNTYCSGSNTVCCGNDVCEGSNATCQLNNICS